MLKTFAIIMALLSILSGFILFLDAIGMFQITRPFTLWILFVIGALLAMGGLYSPSKDAPNPPPGA